MSRTLLRVTLATALTLASGGTLAQSDPSGPAPAPQAAHQPGPLHHDEAPRMPAHGAPGPTIMRPTITGPSVAAAKPPQPPRPPEMEGAPHRPIAAVATPPKPPVVAAPHPVQQTQPHPTPQVWQGRALHNQPPAQDGRNEEHKPGQ